MENSELSDSDSEFWLDLDKKLLKFHITPKPVPEHTSKSLEAQTEEYLATVPNVLYKEKLQTLVSQIRIASEVTLESQLALSKKRLSHSHAKEISDLKYLHRDQVNLLKLEFINLEHQLKEKDLEISKLSNSLIDQELKYTGLRIDKRRKLDDEIKIKDITGTMEANKIAFDMQISHLKEVVEIYKKEADKAIGEFKEMKRMYLDKCEELEKERKEWNEKLIAINSENEKKISSLNDKYEGFKIDVDKELNIRYVINKRQLEFIEVLKEGLKSAKMVIETPRLNAKYLKKIGGRRFSVGQPIMEMEERSISKRKIPRVYPKNMTVNSSFSTSASPIYTNASELDLVPSYKMIEIIPESKYH